MIVLLLVVILVSVASVYIGYHFNDMDMVSMTVSIALMFLLLFVFTSTFARYLKGDIIREKEKQAIEETSKKMVNNKTTVEKEPETKNMNGEEPDAQDDPVNTEQIEVVQKEYAYDDHILLKRKDAILLFSKTESRLKCEIDSLRRRANANMILGTSIGLFGVFGLVAFILRETFTNEEVEIGFLIVRWVTKLGLVSFVEIFAFFFLKVYKDSLISIQYYQDELTGIESRKIALLFSIIHDNSEDISKSIDCLVNIDRNFKMEASQTTVDLEKLKTENSFIKSQMDSMIDIFKGALSFSPKKQE